MNTNALRLGLTVGGLAAAVLGTLVYAAPLASPAKNTVQVQTALDGTGSAERETNLGDLIADAVRATGGADIALVPADEINESTIPAGDVPPSRILAALHYADDSSDTVVVLELTGAQVQKAIERSVSRTPQPFNGFLQVSGLQVRYDASAPEGKRVTLVAHDGSKLAEGQTYKVAVTRPIADGGLGYFQIWDKKDIAENTSQSVAQSVTSWLAAHRAVNSTVEGRITTSNH
jgi:5'-nucleotidase/UDP-sugar diphosphatase